MNVGSSQQTDPIYPHKRNIISSNMSADTFAACSHTVLINRGLLCAAVLPPVGGVLLTLSGETDSVGACSDTESFHGVITACFVATVQAVSIRNYGIIKCNNN